MKKYIKAFTVGSSLVVFIWPLAIYYAFAIASNPNTTYTFTIKAVELALLIGFFNAFYFAIRKWMPKDASLSYWIYGLVLGLLFSVYGIFVADLPNELFEFPQQYHWLIAPGATLSYGLVWRYILKNLNHLFNLEPR